MADYNPNIPAGTDNLSTSAGEIQNNFSQANLIFDVDHFKFNYATTASRGMHRVVTFPEIPAVPTPTLLKGVLFTKSVSSASELCFANKDGNGVLWRGGTGTGLVAGTISGTGTMTLPNGLILKWGSVSASTSGTAVGFAAAFPTNLFNVQLTPQSNTSRGVAFGGQSVNGFTAYAENNGTFIYWFAIGN